MTIADIPVSFLKDCLGYTEDDNGAIFEHMDAAQSPFALLFEVQGDQQPRRFVFYECLASRPSVDAATVKGSIEPSTDTLSFVATPRQADGMVKAVLVKSALNETVYSGFYTSVYEFAAPVG
jgi:phi13 family phage major tail protein